MYLYLLFTVELVLWVYGGVVLFVVICMCDCIFFNQW
ncbi:hypothetical protein SFP17_078 [Shigella phage SFP17]|uniref:Uncharacterized protein n=1 Tax=Shigella phage SFP17 TaxID=2692510 RepID=A0AAE6RI93_9CAUD|nr:hypothetical protein SFP17_078 [Shigella phage SFP17]